MACARKRKKENGGRFTRYGSKEDAKRCGKKKIRCCVERARIWIKLNKQGRYTRGEKNNRLSGTWCTIPFLGKTQVSFHFLNIVVHDAMCKKIGWKLELFFRYVHDFLMCLIWDASEILCINIRYYAKNGIFSSPIFHCDWSSVRVHILGSQNYTNEQILFYRGVLPIAQIFTVWNYNFLPLWLWITPTSGIKINFYRVRTLGTRIMKYRSPETLCSSFSKMSSLIFEYNGIFYIRNVARITTITRYSKFTNTRFEKSPPDV